MDDVAAEEARKEAEQGRAAFVTVKAGMVNVKEEDRKPALAKKGKGSSSRHHLRAHLADALVEKNTVRMEREGGRHPHPDAPAYGEPDSSIRRKKNYEQAAFQKWRSS